MQQVISDKGQGVKVLSVVVTKEEINPFLDKASRKISEQKKLSGFRPGKAPRDFVEKKFGLMAIMEAALDEIISFTYWEALKSAKLSVVGKPQIEIKKVVPGELLEYTAEISILPAIVLGQIENIKIKSEVATVSKDEIEKVVADIRKMRSLEKKVERAAKLGDKTIIDFEVKVNNVIIEGGIGKDYPLILGDNMFIPGFEEKLIGTKVGDEQVFTLNFPTDYKPDLAGKLAEFTVKIKEIWQRDLPELNQDFLNQLGDYKEVAQLEKQIRDNLMQEKQQKLDQKFEIAILNELVTLSNFEEIPHILIENELHRMMHELEDSVANQGLNLEQYLQQINKTKEDLHKDWHEAAEKRVKTALVARQLATEQTIEASSEEIEKEKQDLLASYQDRPEIKQNIESSDFREYLFHTITNRKVVKFLKEKVIENK
jgi:trigger factor